TTPGSSIIEFDAGGALTDTTGLITVSVGSIAYVNITDTPNGMAVDAETRNADENAVKYYASAYDADHNYVGLLAGTWSWSLANDAVGVLSASPSTSVTVNYNLVGVGILDFDSGAFLASTGPVTVGPGALQHIRIENFAGTWIGDTSLTTITNLDVYSRGYDADGNLIGDIEAFWGATGTLDTASLPVGKVTSFTFSPTTDGTSGKLYADEGAGRTNLTGLLTISQWAVDYVQIQDGTDNLIFDMNLAADQTLTLYAIGYNHTAGRLGPVGVTWGRAGDLAGTLGAGPSSSAAFNPTTAGTSGTITIDDGAGNTNQTGTISIIPGALATITITPSPAATNAITPVDFDATGYDIKGNVNTTTGFTWEAQNGTIDANGLFTPWSVGTWNVWANHSGITSSTTVVVTPGALHRIEVSPAAASINADQTQQFIATGFDMNDNIVALVGVGWETDGGNIDASGLYMPGPVGSFTVWANESGVSGSASIEVVVGATDHIVITDDLGNWLGPWFMAAGESMQLYAKAYDAKNNFRENIDVTWSTTGNLGTITAGPSNSVVFSANVALASGRILADDGSGRMNLTGLIQIGPWVVDYIQIEDDANAVIPNMEMAADQTLTLYAIGYNHTAGLLGPVSVTWGRTGTLAGDLNPGPSSSVTFNP
ncbi:MAG: hypothetical protein QCI38_07570, partial [Candidatus Thermoplasmatota archaeon]|nr:hypothetical protein [Candidatus Thermoplasmatota archaeon]